MSCPHVPGELTSRMLSGLIYQYKNSTNFKDFIAVFAEQMEEIEGVCCDIYEILNPANQIVPISNVLGATVGFPRTHCTGTRRRVFGFSIPGVNEPPYIGGFCDETAPWGCAAEGGTETYDTYTFTNEILYKRYVDAKIAMNNSVGTATDIEKVAKILYGAEAHIYSATGSKLVVSAGRALTAPEKELENIAISLIPAPRGVTVEITGLLMLPDC